ncbi:hypothetical protein ABTP16_11515 [Acinetobacter baumannii]
MSACNLEFWPQMIRTAYVILVHDLQENAREIQQFMYRSFDAPL